MVAGLSPVEILYAPLNAGQKAMVKKQNPEHKTPNP